MSFLWHVGDLVKLDLGSSKTTVPIGSVGTVKEIKYGTILTVDWSNGTTTEITLGREWFHFVPRIKESAAQSA